MLLVGDDFASADFGALCGGGEAHSDFAIGYFDVIDGLDIGFIDAAAWGMADGAK